MRKLLCETGLSLLASKVWSFWHQCSKREEQGSAELQGLPPPCIIPSPPCPFREVWFLCFSDFETDNPGLPYSGGSLVSCSRMFSLQAGSFIFCCCSNVDFRSRKRIPVEWLEQEGWKGPLTDHPLPQGRINSTKISFWTDWHPDSSRKQSSVPFPQCIPLLHQIHYKWFLLLPESHVPSLQFKPGCLLRSTKNMENRLYSFLILLFFMYLNIVKIPGSPEYMGFVSSTPEYNTELFKAVNFPY